MPGIHRSVGPQGVARLHDVGAISAARRVLVLGSPGAGKSTLARRLAPTLGLPLVHLDRVYWGPGWVSSPPERFEAAVRSLVAGPRWIIDGNYASTLAPRLARADHVLWLDFSTPLCLYRSLRRQVLHRGRSRPDMAELCAERFDPAFLAYVAAFRRRVRPELARWRDSAPDGQAWTTLASPRAVERLFAALGRSPRA